MGLMRKNPDQWRAVELCDRIRELDFTLMALVLNYQRDMTLKGAGELVKIQTKLRQIRYVIEIEAGVEAVGTSGPSWAMPERG
ncbi:hypothetical protein [Chachezhania sediminis]|uniref:hypothetical protein n=1 Tax=Chachezhania sediminis TaxID=2599291 RepID=UPI00131BC896|nr:hypothetical protein [Chachezhania sediminis]